jgi:hypothetical protein
MLRLIHNRSIVKYFLPALGIAFALYFAWSFYPFGEYNGPRNVRHEVACDEGSERFQSSVQDCLQSFSAFLVTGGWKARDTV